MRIEEIGADVAVITLLTGVDAAAGPRLGDAIAGLRRAGRRRVVVDLASTPLVNSRVLDVLVACAGDFDPRAGEGLAVVTGTGYLRQVLSITRRGGLVFMAETRAEALAALGA